MLIAAGIVLFPALAFLVIWVVVTAFRIWSPDHPVMLEASHDHTAHILRAVFPVGVREIAREQRERTTGGARRAYTYSPAYSTGCPPQWEDDLWVRRN